MKIIIASDLLITLATDLIGDRRWSQGRQSMEADHHGGLGATKR